MMPFAFKIGTTGAMVGFLLLCFAAVAQMLGSQAVADCFGYPALGLMAAGVIAFVIGALELLWSNG